MNKLPTYKGYTIDERLREFRKVTYDKQGNPSIEFIPFESEKGKALLFAINLETALS
jgi:hypothetical protein